MMIRKDSLQAGDGIVQVSRTCLLLARLEHLALVLALVTAAAATTPGTTQQQQ
jgi:hypothetical protein